MINHNNLQQQQFIDNCKYLQDPTEAQLLAEEALNNKWLRHSNDPHLSSHIIPTLYGKKESNTFFITENDNERIFINRTNNEVFSILKDTSNDYDPDYPPLIQPRDKTENEKVLEELQYNLACARGMKATTAISKQSRRKAILRARRELREYYSSVRRAA